VNSVADHAALAVWEGPDEVVWNFTGASSLYRELGVHRKRGAWKRRDPEAVAYAEEQAKRIIPNMRAAAEKIGAPWFSADTTPDGESLKNCPCDSFSKRAKAAGYLPTSIGVVGHLIPMVVLPTGDKEQQIAIRFPAQYDLSKEVRV
jgi:hypothetical protein